MEAYLPVRSPMGPRATPWRRSRFLAVVCGSASLPTAWLGRAQGRQHEKRGETRSQRMKKGWRKARLKLVFRRVVARPAGPFPVLRVHRLLDDPLLDDGRRPGRAAFRRWRSTGRGPSGRRTGDDGSAARRALVPHEGPALVTHGRRHGVEGAAGRTGLRAHLPHLLFLAEPVFEREEGRLPPPPVLELGLRERAPQLPRGFLLELLHDLVVLEAHLLLVIRHLELAGRELDAALGTLLHVDGDPGLAVRALRHVFLELDAALRARRRVLRDEGATLPALDHLAESEDFPVEGDANPGRHGGGKDDQEQPPLDAEA